MWSQHPFYRKTPEMVPFYSFGGQSPPKYGLAPTSQRSIYASNMHHWLNHETLSWINMLLKHLIYRLLRKARSQGKNNGNLYALRQSTRWCRMVHDANGLSYTPVCRGVAPHLSRRKQICWKRQAQFRRVTNWIPLPARPYDFNVHFDMICTM